MGSDAHQDRAESISQLAADYKNSPRTAVMMRELAKRTNDGLTVRLLWDGAEKVYVQLWDVRNEAIDEFPVPRASALDAFEHPFRYEPATAAVRI